MHFQRLSVLFVFAAALFGSLATPLPTPWGEMLVKHKWTHIPETWVVLSDPPEGAMIDLYIALKPDRENVLIDALKEVSQPGHPKYGAHLTKEQVVRLVAPHPDTLELVGSWLRHNGVQPSSISTTHCGSWMTVSRIPVSRANKLLGASYQLYHHPGTNETVLRTTGYALPSALHMHVQTIAPTTAFTSAHRLQPKEMLRGFSGGAVNSTSGEPVNILSGRQPDQQLPIIHPSFLRWLYRTESYLPVTQVNWLGIMGQLNEIPSLMDLGTFLDDFRADIGHPIPFIRAVDERRSVKLGFQANIDTQYTMALAYPTPIIYYMGTGTGVQELENGDPAYGDQYVQWLDYMSREGIVPQTITMGYGTPEPHISKEYAHALCQRYAQLGARGVTLLVASGDTGVGQGECIDFFGNRQFYTTFPASCPWVTSVGGTTWNSDEPEEVAYSSSGGGFSAYFTRNEYRWQDVEVPAFFEKFGSDHDGLYERGGRGVPDIALEASRYIVVSTIPGQSADNKVTHYVVSSTGGSTNTAAAVISQLNDYRLSIGMPSFGFLNPWLYEIGWVVFNDIISGNNPGCGTTGFTAKEGWDPVTGLGSPDFEKLQKLIDFDKSTTIVDIPEDPPIIVIPDDPNDSAST